MLWVSLSAGPFLPDTSGAYFQKFKGMPFLERTSHPEDSLLKMVMTFCRVLLVAACQWKLSTVISLGVCGMFLGQIG